jgi:ubiquinone/menaquinone biosynthesis C-methylase UbiE
MDTETRGTNVANGDQNNQEAQAEASYLGMAAWMHRVTEPAIRGAIRALQLPQGSRGLDVGCGIGTHTMWLAEAISPGGHVTGIDISRDHLTQGEKIAHERGLEEQVSFRYGNMSALPFDDDTFDWVWNVDILYVAPKETGMPADDPLPILNEMARVTKPGGTIAVLFWSSQKLLPGYPLLEARLNATYAANFIYTDDTKPESHILRCLGWLQAAGFKDTQAQTFVADVQPPLDDATRNGLMAIFQMFWENTESEASQADWAEFQRLCQPDSPDFILNLPDYYAFITYTLFYARVPF